MPQKAQGLFHKRLGMFNTSVENRDQDSGTIKIAPKVDGRIKSVRDPLTHDD